MKLYSLLLLCLFSASCINTVSSTKPVPTKELSNTVYSGKSAITGKVVTIEGHNKIVTRERSEVVLVPVCEASTDIIGQIYKNPVASSRSVKDHPRIDWGRLNDFKRVTYTDETGKFFFSSLSPGEYYILSYINVRDNLSNKGGSVMRKLNLENGKMKEISLRL